MNKYLPKIKQLLPLFLLIELISYLGYYWHAVNVLGFLLLTALGVYFGIKKYHYLIGLLLAELIIGSKGYLFVLTLGGFHLSIRMALWCLVLVFWFGRVAWQYWQQKDTTILRQELLPTEAKNFWPLLIVVLFATVNGVAHGNGLGNIYSDANAWFYFLLLWPITHFLKKLKQIELDFFVALILTAVGWLTIKTWLILYFFSHDFLILEDMYHWVRDSGVGEITAMAGSFYRIFIQSHVYPLIALVVAWYYLLRQASTLSIRKLINDPVFLTLVGSASALLSVIFIGLSRSFWVGLLIVLLALFLKIFSDRQNSFSFKIRLSLRFGFGLFISAILALFIVFIIIRFPFPHNTLEFNATDVLSERATQTNESAIGSRWALLPVLGGAIEKHWLLGQGFGASVTYESKDPRVIKSSGGVYTTYAFEWGWLDLWLKLGLIGLLAYIYLLYKLWQGAVGPYQEPVRLAIVALVSLHIFTPYLNHPLGIGLLLLLFSVNFYQSGFQSVVLSKGTK
jgi:hypothetical protein